MRSKAAVNGHFTAGWCGTGTLGSRVCCRAPACSAYSPSMPIGPTASAPRACPVLNTGMFGVVNSYGIELIHLVRQGRTQQSIGQKGRSNHRWIVGGKLWMIVNQWDRIGNWDWNTANVHDSVFHPMIRRFQQRVILLSDQGVHAKTGNPANLKGCPRRTWGERMIIETVFSMLTRISRFKQQTHRAWAFTAYLSFAMAASICWRSGMDSNPMKTDSSRWLARSSDYKTLAPLVI